MLNSVEVGIFIKDENIRGVYIPLQPQQFLFPFLRVSPSSSDMLLDKGIKYVVQSFVKLHPEDKLKTKILHSGLKMVKEIEECFFGDNINLKTDRKDFFILQLTGKVLKMYYFKNRNPRNKTKFVIAFLQGIANM
ncbi:hypothetical protein [Flavobacterium gyeonganense]|uniref:Uncharacterized protein n=1 Tax=Flavobacterium gyeonganense TaxID=1310418 RepID=A0ABV5H8T4_9FLAO|nr:hypothetical protein [Flavobacterium gyeonganense]